ncbi:MAG TPA: sulfatase-like hydrolase/transferase [Planctomycetaceae bacterium]|nr:sulfatase-like hydrolase/transferase [Planctomycetaceae bacterium]
MKRCIAALCVCHALLGGTLAAAAPRDRDGAQPNIVFLFVDDMAYGDLSCTGAPDAKTPRLDRLADEGARFTSFYSAAPECTPSRTAFLTGRYPQRPGGLECAIGVGNVGRYDDAIALARRHDLGLPAEDAVLAPALREAGYATALVGKWHLGYEPQFHPLEQGFDRFFGFLGGNIDYFTHREQSDLHVLYDDRRPVEREGYITHLIADESIRFIRENRARPYFLFVAFNVPHFPYQGPADAGLPLADEQWTTGTRAKYVEMLEDMDRQIGRILDALDESGAGDRTLVAFASDNGGTAIGRGLPFSGHKGTLFEGGLRSPLIVRFPGRIAPGTLSGQPAITMDLTASFLRVAGATPLAGRPPEGIDLLRHVEEGGPDRPRRFFWRYRRGERTWRAVRDGTLKYIHRADGPAEGREESEWLFDLTNDTAEEHNLLSERAAAAERLRAALRIWEQDVRSPRLERAGAGD